MKKLLLSFLLCVSVLGQKITTPGGLVSDAPYGPTWNGVTRISPSLNAVYDILQVLDPDGDLSLDFLPTEDPVMSGSLTGGALIESQRIVETEFSLGTISDGGTATLNTTHDVFTLTSVGATFTIALTTGIPEGWKVIHATSTYSDDQQEVTLPNLAYRLEMSAATNKFYLPQGTAVPYEVYLYVTNSASPGVSRFSVIGDDFSPQTPASVVEVVPSGNLTATAQGSLESLDTLKVNRDDLHAVATNGSYASLINRPPTISSAQIESGGSSTPGIIAPDQLKAGMLAISPPRTNVYVYAAGTAYSLTATPAALDFGTTDPALTIPQSGRWLVRMRANVAYNGATFAANRTVTLTLRRTNNTPADLDNGSEPLTTDVTTTKTETLSAATTEVVYDTLNSDDVITIFGDVSATPSAGSLDVVRASIFASRVGDYEAADSTPPELSSATIDTTGTNLTLVLDEIVSIGAGGNGGVALTASGGSATATYSTGEGTDTLIYTLNRVINEPETVTLDYTQPGNGIEDTSGNDLASINDAAVTNDSTQNTSSLQQTIGGSGGTAISLGNSVGREWVGFSFTADDDYTLTSVGAFLRASGSPSGNMTGYIYTTSAGVPTSTVLATSSNSINTSTLTGSYAEYGFTFPDTVLVSGTTYFFATRSPVDSSNFAQWQTASPGTATYYRSSNGNSWTDQSGGTPNFNVYGY